MLAELLDLHKEFVCIVCELKFQKNVFPSDKTQIKLFCSRSCQMSHTRSLQGCSPMKKEICVCLMCSLSFSYKRKQHQNKRKFCSRKCASKKALLDGDSAACGYEKKYARWSEKFGSEEACRRLKLFKEKKTAATTARNKGRSLSADTKKMISKSCTGLSNPLKGKTFASFYGVERATALADHHSKMLREGYESGKIKPSEVSLHQRTYGKPCLYKGIRLRSQLERKVVVFLENNYRLVLGESLLYEDNAVKTQWKDDSGKSHTYFPDLHDIKNHIVYEVKPSSLVKNPTETMIRKMESLKNAGFECRYLTELDTKEK